MKKLKVDRWAVSLNSIQLLPIHPHPTQLVTHINGLVQERRNSIANVLELRLSCTNPSIYRYAQQIEIFAQRKAANGINRDISSVGPLGTNFSDMCVSNWNNFSENYFKIPFAKRRSLCSSTDEFRV